MKKQQTRKEAERKQISKAAHTFLMSGYEAYTKQSRPVTTRKIRAAK